MMDKRDSLFLTAAAAAFFWISACSTAPKTPEVREEPQVTENVQENDKTVSEAMTDEEKIEVLKTTIESYKADTPPNYLEAARGYLHLGDLYIRQEKKSEALKAYSSGVEWYKKSTGEDRELLFSLQGERGRILYLEEELRDDAEAYKALSESIESAEAFGAKPSAFLGDLYCYSAYLSYIKYEDERADTHFRKSIAAYQASGDKGALANVKWFYAVSILNDQKRNNEAKAQLRETCQIAEQLGEAINKVQLAVYYRDLTQFLFLDLYTAYQEKSEALIPLANELNETYGKLFKLVEGGYSPFTSEEERLYHEDRWDIVQETISLHKK
jgi:tetratricopeptide (TPR) repeat protein